jgi:hypothetical protein
MWQGNLRAKCIQCVCMYIVTWTVLAQRIAAALKFVLCWAARRYGRGIVSHSHRYRGGVDVRQLQLCRGRHVVTSVRSRGAEVGGDGVIRLCVCPRQRPAIMKGCGVGCIQSSFLKLKSSMHEETVEIECGYQIIKRASSRFGLIITTLHCGCNKQLSSTT